MIHYPTVRSFLLVLALLLAGATIAGAQASSSTPGTDRGPLLKLLERKERAGKIGGDLLELYERYLAHQKSKSRLPFQPGNRWLRLDEDRVVIDAAAEDAVALRASLEALGLRDGATFGRMVSGWLPISALGELARLDGLRFARPAYSMRRTGLTTSQGDAAMEAADARAFFGVDGSGVVVGTLSDSYNCQGGAAADVASGDLPPGVVVLLEEPGCGSGSDEGRAMMQLIADVAPGASQVFHTANTGQAGFAQGIVDLASVAGADVIVDDVYYFAEPMFQDGVIAQAVDGVVAQGVPYFSAVGNQGQNSYQGFYQPAFEPVTGGPVHDFDPGPGIDVYQSFSLAEGAELLITFQWDSPYFSAGSGVGSANDYEVLVFDDPPTDVLWATSDDNLGGDPIEVLRFVNPPGSGVTDFNLAFLHVAGPEALFLKYVVLDLDGSINEYYPGSSTVFGHPNAAGAEAVGAAYYADTPHFGQYPPLLEAFSSVGPTLILFNLIGTRYAALRDKPEIVAPDGTNNTFFGSDFDADGMPNFFGTSAAAPHAAAVAALLLERFPGLRPGDVYSVLESTAEDMAAPGFDYDTGFGLIQAGFALDAPIFLDGFETGDTSIWSSEVGGGGSCGVARAWTGLSGSAEEELRYTFAVGACATTATFQIFGGTGDADLYVRFVAPPTTEDYNCRPYLDGNEETCTFTPAPAGTYQIMVRGFLPFSGVTLVASYE